MWRDGELIAYADATIHVLSHAAHRGTEVFDVLRVLNSDDGPMAVGLRPHVARFDRSMDLMGMERPFDIGTLERAVATTVLANPGSETVKLVAAWADVSSTSRPAQPVPTVFVAALPPTTPEPGDAARAAGGVRLRTAVMPKMPASILPPSLKVAAAYAPGVRQQIEAEADGFDDVIFQTVDGKRLAEATTQSLFAVTGGRMHAPMLDTVLDGITRRLLIDLAIDDGIVVDVSDVSWEEVLEADELILTSTNKFVRPVAALDDRTYEAPGPIATRLAALVDDVASGAHPLASRWLTPLRSLAE